MQAYKKKGFWVGISLFIACNLLPPPPGLSEAGWVVASVTILMAAWWATEEDQSADASAHMGRGREGRGPRQEGVGTRGAHLMRA